MTEAAPARLAPTGAAVVGHVLANELRRGLLGMWANRGALLIGMASLGAVYLGIMLVVGYGSLPRDLLPATLLGMAAYVALWVGSLQMVGDELQELRAGTLEQVHLSPVPPGVVIVGRLVVVTLQGALVSLALVLTVALATGVAYPPRWAALAPLALTLVQVAAFTLLFTGAVLAVPFVGEIHHLVVSLVAFFNGSFLPVALLPGWLQPFARLMPTTIGVEATIAVLRHEHTLAQLWSSGALPWLLLHTAVLLAAAWAVYVRNYRRALQHGGLGRY